MKQQISDLHSCYCEVSGLSINARVHERAFQDFLSSGFTVDDMRLVLTHLKRENKRMNGAAFSLRIDKLLDFEYRRFDSILSEAKAKNRNRVVQTPSEQVLQEWRKLPSTAGTATTAKPVKDILRACIDKL